MWTEQQCILMQYPLSFSVANASQYDEIGASYNMRQDSVEISRAGVILFTFMCLCTDYYDENRLVDFLEAPLHLVIYLEDLKCLLYL